MLATTALTSIAAPALAQGLPTGASVAYGSVGFQRSSGTLTINQGSQNAIVNYKSFSIGRRNTVNINQPNSSSVLLNRVTGNTPSTIAGRLNANGQVYLINPNGIAITKTGVVKVGGGFVASSLGISDGEFLKGGRKHFKGNGASATVSNAGAITVGRGGYAALIGGEVRNKGTIAVPMGKVGLGSGEMATLDVSGDGFLQVALPTTRTGKGALVSNSGLISAAGGTVVMDAATARAAARNAVNISGTIDAHSISGHSGSIVLGGGAGGKVAVSGTLNLSGGTRYAGGTVRVTGRRIKVTGTIDASGKSGGTVKLAAANGTTITGTVKAVGHGGKGGSVTVTGLKIALAGAHVDASGKTGGGTVKLGGDAHGAGPLPNANTVTIDPTSVIKADATGIGDGGSVVVWSQLTTAFAGTISAQGGLGGGDGGSAEVSSKGVLAYTGITNLLAPHGFVGTLLLDPENVTISSAADSNQSGFTATGDNSVINTTTLQTALATANVTVSTGTTGNQAGNITIASPLSWASGSLLTLTAVKAIAVDAPVTISGAGKLALNTGTTTVGGTTQPLLSFGMGDSIAYTGAAGSGQTLAINSTSYTLIYTMAQLAGLTGGTNAIATNLAPTQTYTSAVVTTAFNGTLEGLGHTITGLTINSPTNNGYVGLIGTLQSGTVRDIGLVGGSVYATGNVIVGALVGLNHGNVIQDYASTAVSVGTGNAGGLVGQSDGTITQSYATGSVSGTVSGFAIGGLAGGNYGSGVISQSYATGAVSNPGGGQIGGIVGLSYQQATISQTYATGAVSGTGTIGGLVGLAANVSQSYFDVSTSGTTAGTGNNQGGVIGLTTAQLQSGSASGLGSAFGGGTGGLYPYLASSYPNGAQAITGTAQTATGTALAGAQVGVYSGGAELTGATTSSGANGYVYEIVPGGTLAASGVKIGATVTPSGTTTPTGLAFTDAGTVTGNVLTLGTVKSGLLRETTAEPNFSGLQSDVSATIGAAVSTLPTSATIAISINATGASFTLDQAVTAGGAYSIATTGGPLTLAGSLSASGQTVTLSSAGTISQTGGTLTAGTLTGSSAGAASFTRSGNAITNLGAFTTGNGALALTDGVTALGLIGAISAGTGTLTLANTAGTISQTAGTLTAGTLVGSSAGDSSFALTGNSIGNLGAFSVGGTGNLSLSDGAALAITGTVAAPGTLKLTASSTVTESGGAINAGSVALLGTGGAYTLTATGNSIGTLAANTGSVSVADAADLTIGTVGATTGVTTSGAVAVTTAGKLTIASGSAVSGQSPVLAAGGAFVNNAGANALTATSGRWLVYSSSPGADTFGGLNSADMAIFDATVAGLPPTSVSQTGNRYLFANQPTLTVTTTNDSKVYGTNATTKVATDYTITGFDPGVSGAYLGDAATATSGTPTVTSAGSAIAAGVAGGSYAISAAQGSLASPSGYAIVFSNAGTLAVTPLAVTLSGTQTYNGGTAAAASGLTVTDAVAGDSVGLSGSGTLAGKDAGPEALTSSNGALAGLSVANGNYTVAGGSGTVTVSPLAVTLSGTQTYNGGTAAAASGLTVTDSVTGDSVGLSGSGTLAAKNAGPEALTSSNGALAGLSVANGNYTVTGGSGTVTISPAMLSYIAAGASRTYGAANPALSGSVTGFVGGDTQAGATTGSASFASAASAADNVGTYAITGSGLTAANGNYVFTQAAGNAHALTVTPAPLTVSGAKTYDAGTGFATGQLAVSGAQNGESVTLTQGSGTTASAEAGSYAGSALSNLAIAVSGGNAAASNYALPGTGTLAIGQATITVTGATGVDKTYDAGTSLPGSATGFSYTGVIGGNATVSAAAAHYAGADAGSEPVAVSGLTISGPGAGDYVLSATGVTGSGTISPAMLSYIAAGASRTYGAANPALSGSVTGFVGGDTQAGATTGSASFASAASAADNVGTYAITGSGLTAANGNYVFTQAAGNAHALTVTPAPLTVSGAKTYDAGTGFATGQLAVSGAQNGESVTLTQGSGTTASAEAGSYAGSALSNLAIAVSGGNAAASNYALPGTGTLAIGQATITVTGATGVDKTYDAGTSLPGSATGFSYTGVIGGNATVSAAAAHYAGADAGSEPVAVSGLTISGPGAGDYVLSATGVTGSGTISPAMLSYIAAGASRTYGAANPALSGSVTGFVGGDTQAGATTGSASFASAASAADNVGTYAITGSGLTAANGNYVFTQAAGNAHALTVTPAPLTVSGAKTYDAGTGFATGQLAVSGAQNGESVTLTQGSGTTASAEAGSYAGSALSNLAIAVSGGNAAASNYALPGTGTLAIGQATITVTGATGVDKTYDAGTSLPGSATGFSYTGVIGGNATVSAAAAHYAGADAGSEPVAVSGLTISGPGAGDYVLSATGVTGSGTISPAMLSYIAAGASRTYGAANPALSGSVTGFVGGDTQAGATTGSASFASAASAADNVGTYAITGSGLTAANGNYVFTQAAGNAHALTVTPAPLTVSGAKTYDAGTGFATGQLAVSGAQNGESVTLTQGSGTTASAEAGSYAGSALSNLAIAVSGGNAAASNYALPGTGTLAIGQATITVTGATGVDKTYDAGTSLPGSATGFSYTGVIGGNATVSAAAAHYAGADAGSEPVAVSGLTISGPGAGDYVLSATGVTGSGTISPAMLSYIAAGASRTYGAANPALSGSVTGFVGGDTQAGATTGSASFASAASAADNVGTYAITGSGLTAANGNYVFTQAAGNAHALTVTPAPLTVSGAKTYDAGTGFATGQLAVSGAQNGESVTLTQGSGTTASAEAGSYAGSALSNLAIAVSGGNAAASNYALPGTGTLAIGQATITVTTYDALRTNIATTDSAISGVVTGLPQSAPGQGSAGSVGQALGSFTTAAISNAVLQSGAPSPASSPSANIPSSGISTPAPSGQPASTSRPGTTQAASPANALVAPAADAAASAPPSTSASQASDTPAAAPSATQAAPPASVGAPAETAASAGASEASDSPAAQPSATTQAVSPAMPSQQASPAAQPGTPADTPSSSFQVAALPPSGSAAEAQGSAPAALSQSSPAQSAPSLAGSLATGNADAVEAAAADAAGSSGVDKADAIAAFQGQVANALSAGSSPSEALTAGTAAVQQLAAASTGPATPAQGLGATLANPEAAASAAGSPAAASAMSAALGSGASPEQAMGAATTAVVTEADMTARATTPVGPDGQLAAALGAGVVPGGAGATDSPHTQAYVAALAAGLDARGAEAAAAQADSTRAAMESAATLPSTPERASAASLASGDLSSLSNVLGTDVEGHGPGSSAFAAALAEGRSPGEALHALDVARTSERDESAQSRVAMSASEARDADLAAGRLPAGGCGRAGDCERETIAREQLKLATVPVAEPELADLAAGRLASLDAITDPALRRLLAARERGPDQTGVEAAPGYPLWLLVRLAQGTATRGDLASFREGTDETVFVRTMLHGLAAGRSLEDARDAARGLARDAPHTPLSATRAVETSR